MDFCGGKELIHTKEVLDAADIGKLRPRWDGRFIVAACPSPNAYTLALQRKMRCSPTVNVDRLKPFVTRAGTSPAPGLVSDTGHEGKHEAELLLNPRQLVRGVLRYLVRCWGYTSADSDYTWLQLDELAHCPEKVAEYDAAAPRRHTARRIARGTGPAPSPAPNTARCAGPAPAEPWQAAAEPWQAAAGPPDSRIWCDMAARRPSGRR